MLMLMFNHLLMPQAKNMACTGTQCSIKHRSPIRIKTKLNRECLAFELIVRDFKGLDLENYRLFAKFQDFLEVFWNFLYFENVPGFFALFPGTSRTFENITGTSKALGGLHNFQEISKTFQGSEKNCT